MLTIENLHFAFGEKSILKNVSACFEPHQLHGIIGPNGAGKSTLLKNICRIWEPQRGTVYINDADYRRISRKQLSTLITLVPQNATASFPISVYEMVAMGRHPHLGRFQALAVKDRTIIENALQVTQVINLKDRNINELSGGECQLSVIARALATEAAIIMLDEPTSDLDIKHALTIMELLSDLKHQGKTIIINIHDLNLAKRYCDTITIIHEGKIFFNGVSDDAFSKENMQRVFNVGMEKITQNSKSFLFFFRPSGALKNGSKDEG